MCNIYTIGHSQHSIQHFIGLLKRHSINHVVDVRSVPYSRYAPQHNKESIEKFLNQSDIKYIFMGEALGARQSDRVLYGKEGYLDFSLVAKSEKFTLAINKLILGMDKGHKIALMCAEKEPTDCHRTILISNEFYNRGIIVKHIYEDGTIKTQKEINTQLLDKYFPERSQLSIFDEQGQETRLLEKVYRLKNKEIGYSIQK